MKIIKSLCPVTTIAAVLVVSAGLAFPIVQDEETAKPKPADQIAPADVQFAPVDNMHHFMEYICEPSYKSLKEIMVKAPEDRRGWKAFKNHALVLAESSALVAARGPKDDEEKNQQWNQISQGVHSTGSALYKAAGNFEEATKQYGLMIDNCNKCHTVFAEGKHQLEK